MKTEVIAAASMFIALCALGAAIYNSHLTRRHYRLSILPFITSWTSDGWENTRTYNFKLTNSGIGPAIIKSFDIKVDGNLVEGTGMEKIDKAKELLFPEGISDFYRASFGANYVMPAGEEKIIFSLGGTLDSQLDTANIKASLSRVTLHIKYESLYGEKFTFGSLD